MKFLELDNSENSVGQHFEKQRNHYLQKSIYQEKRKIATNKLSIQLRKLKKKSDQIQIKRKWNNTHNARNL